MFYITFVSIIWDEMFETVTGNIVIIWNLIVNDTTDIHSIVKQYVTDWQLPFAF